MEPIYEIGKYYQETEQYEKAYKWLIKACAIPFPKNQVLFLFKDIYEYRVWDALGIAGYYVGEYKIAIDACIKALKSDFCSPGDAERIKNNMRFSLNKLKNSFNFNEKNTFCISLESDKNRWDNMCKRFKLLSIECTRWIASTPDTLTDIFWENLNPLQKACSQSHVNIWRHIIKNNLPYVLILEDDAKFDKNWSNKIKQINIDGEWDAIFLNASEPISPKEKWVIVKDQYLTGAYIISQEGAKYILEKFSDSFAASDWMTSRLQERGKSYSYFPWLVIQEGNYSTITSDHEADHKKVLTCLNKINYSLNNYI